MNKAVIKNCPLCGSKNFSHIITKNYLLNSLGVEISQTYCICDKCAFIFTRDPLTENWLKKYYESNTQERKTKVEKNELDHIKKQIVFLNNYIDLSRSTVLEIGANNGSFLDVCKANGSSKLRFLEFNKRSLAILAGKKYLKDFSLLRESNRLESNDVIALFHTLEHIVDPRKYIRKIKRYLKDDGVLFVEVPDFTFFDKHTDELQFEHVNFFSERTLAKLFHKCGLTIIAASIDLDENYPACPKHTLRMIVKKSSAVPAKNSQRIIALCRKENEKIKVFKKINLYLRKIGKRQRVGIYSASWLTNEFFRKTGLSFNIIAIFDRDKKKQGSEINGITIYKPQALKTMNIDHLIIINEGYETEIRKDIKTLGFPGNRIKGWSDFM